ncbi:MAG: glycosyl transferase, partial [Acidobacteriia bacterium]|nr:glycosyl transferase [Terriglobia bacterium]
FTFLPPVLAHAGLATTDMALTAMLTAAFLMFIVWVGNPTWKKSLAFGAISALTVLSKFSSLVYFPAACGSAAVWYLFTHRPSIRETMRAVLSRLAPLCMAATICLVVVWAGYRFSFGTSHFLSMKVAAPELFDGIEQVKYHNSNGHLAYLFGKHSQYGWWYYYFVVLALKTPLPFLALLGIGMFGAVKGNRGVQFGLLFAGGVLIVAIFSHINIGVRHVLPIYVGMSIAAAAGAVKLFEQSNSSTWAGWTGVVLIGWMVATSIASHPDYIPYFNVLAGDEPENILADSDLDWGQDNKRLGQRLTELGATEVNFSQFFYADLKALGYPSVREIDATKPAPGWNAVNLTLLKAVRFGWGDDHPEWQIWMNQIKPTERIGKGIWLWYIPPGSVPGR